MSNLNVICRFCEQPKRPIKAHVIPEAFFRRLREGKRPPILIRQNCHARRSPIGIYDSAILCADCDQIFAPWDDYAQKLLSPQLKNTQAIADGNQIAGWTIADYNYDFLKLFFISLVWRASVSQNSFYRRIKLGSLEPIAKEMIARRDAGPPERFGAIAARFPDARAGGMLDPHRQRFDGISYGQFYLRRYVAYIKTDSRPPSKFWRASAMAPGQPLCIFARDLERSKDVAVMREVLASSKLMRRNRHEPV